MGERLSKAWSELLRRPALFTGLVLSIPVVYLLADHFLRGRDAPRESVEVPIERPDADSVPRPAAEVGKVRVYTRGAERGFAVLVDGDAVRMEDGALLRTPCELEIDAREIHRITVAKPGFRDETKTVSASSADGVQLVFDPAPDPDGNFASLMDVPWFHLEVGQPLALESLNTRAPEGDPFLTENGLAIYFTSEGALSGGVQVATRSTPFEPFGPPATIPLTRDALSPSVLTLEDPESGEIETHLAFASKSSVRSAVRENVLQGFTGRDVLRSDPDRRHDWTAARLLDGGHVLYWTRIENGDPRTYFSVREQLGVPFETAERVELPGGVPCLSHDGLRQYGFDGRRLTRAVRSGIYEMKPGKNEYGAVIDVPRHLPFSNPQTIGEVEIDDFRPDPGRRQFFVSRDEQWMFYSNESSNGDLYVVRLRTGPGWGVVPRGRSIPDEDFSPEVVAVRTEPGETPFEGVEQPRDDPRDEPLPYTAHRAEFKKLMSERKYDEAAELARRRIGEEPFESAQSMLEWDLADVDRARRFWTNVETGAKSLEPGDEFSNGSVDLSFVEFEDGILVGELGDKTHRLTLREMRAVDVVSLADRAIEDANAEQQIEVATFLDYEPGTVARALDARINRAGRFGDEYVERMAGRLLGQARLEFERDNYRPGLAWLAKLREYAPDSRAALEADSVENGLYLQMKWQIVGSRKWEGSLEGRYTADADRAPDSYLLSPRAYQNFELSMEYRVTAENGAGGVYFRYAEPQRRKPYEMDAAYKVQLANDAGVAPDSFVTGALFSVEAPTKNAAKPLGEWNTLRMTVRGQKVAIWVNEERVLDATLDNAGIPLEGYIALDGITGGITYRKVLVLELPKSF